MTADLRSVARWAYAEYLAVAAAAVVPFPAWEPILGHWTVEPEELDWDPVPVWELLGDAVVLVLV